jgi:prepilin-type N-terminal cleavage/methylation domain-containing protein/prepilin-type processing-associated H-X9-DG protein
MREPALNLRAANRSREIQPVRPFYRAAFSLIELLVVVAVLAVLLTLFFGFGSSGHSQRLIQQCEANLQKIHVSLEIYARDHAEKFPETPGARTSEEALSVLVPKYTADTSIFICPASKDSPLPAGESFRDRTISYAYYMGRRLTATADVLMSDRQVNSGSKTAGQPVFSRTGQPPGNNHQKSGGNLLFCDGNVAASPADTSVSLVLTPDVVLLNPKP